MTSVAPTAKLSRAALSNTGAALLVAKAPGVGLPRKMNPPEPLIAPEVVSTMAPPEEGGAIAAKLIGTASVTMMACTMVAVARPLSVVARATGAPTTSAKAAAAKADERPGDFADMVLS